MRITTAHVFTVFALVAANLASVWAQQPAAASPDQAASEPRPPLPSPMINRWVDAHGRVHYSDALPPDAPEQTTEVGPVQSATPEQKARADAQMQTYRGYLQQPPAASQSNAAKPAPEENRLPQDRSCAGQWARFNAAAACASQYHVKGGGLRGEMAEHCPVVPQPQCPPPRP
jgi:hypothetical protein